MSYSSPRLSFFKDKMRKKDRLFSSFLTFWAVLVLYAGSFPAQQIDPFYLRLFEKAQKSFLAKYYQDAARDFEIAAFGFTEDKTLRAKAYVYISLCRFYLKDLAASERYLREAADLMAGEGFEALEILKSALPDLEKLQTLYNIAPAQQEAPPPPDLSVTENPLKATSDDPNKPAKKAPDTPGRKAAAEALQISLDNIKEGDLVPLDLVDTRPVVLKRVQAVYPSSARGSGTEGTVLVNVLISEKGAVIKTEIINGIKGAYGFNQESQRVVRQWKFEAATIKGVKVKVWLPISIAFKIQTQ
jgi:TonB family protein